MANTENRKFASPLSQNLNEGTTLNFVECNGMLTVLFWNPGRNLGIPLYGGYAYALKVRSRNIPHFRYINTLLLHTGFDARIYRKESDEVCFMKVKIYFATSAF